jgi:hypothetical protein
MQATRSNNDMRRNVRQTHPATSTGTGIEAIHTAYLLHFIFYDTKKDRVAVATTGLLSWLSPLCTMMHNVKHTSWRKAELQPYLLI